MSRIIIVGGPSRGKSTLAHELHERHGWPVYCGDPASKVVYRKPYTNYLPEELPYAGDGGASDWVASHWFTRPGPWICEGHVMARALRRWTPNGMTRHGEFNGSYPCDRIIVLDRPAHRETSKGQEAMHKGVMKVWREIAHYYREITEVRT
jgi:AAA domain